jgi:hypothetical protein
MMGGGMGMMGGGGDMMLFGLLRIEEVQKEIDLMDDQISAVGKIGEKLQAAERPDFSGMRDATEEKRAELMEKMRVFSEEQGKMISEQLEEVLLPEQFDRLREIGLQQQGASAFSDPKVVAKLVITEDQKKKLETQQTEFREKMVTEMRAALEGGGDREAMVAKVGEMRDAQVEDAKSVLTSEQKETFAKMLGKPFDMPEGAMRGGFGGGGRRGGQPGGGGGGGGGGRGGRGGRGGDGGNDA